MKTTELLRRLTAAPSAPGTESPAANAIREALEGVADRFETDTLGNLKAVVNEDAADGVILLAHMDKIGCIVTGIDEETGFLRIDKCGGFDARVAPALRVTVLGQRPLPGVIISTPPHLASPDSADKAAPLDKLGVDCGLPFDEIRTLVFPGDRIVTDAPFFELNENRVCGPYLDDCAGVAALIRCAELVKTAGRGRRLECVFTTREEVRTATLGTVQKVLPARAEDRPGIFVVGRVVRGGWPRLGVLAGRRVLVTCSDAVQERAATAVEDRGGRPIRWPLIKLCATRPFGKEVADYDAIVLTSPSAVRIFFANCTCDLRCLGAFYTCGAGTDAELRRHGIASDVMPAQDFSAAGLVAEIKKLDLRGKRVLRLRSAKAGADVARALRRAGAKVDDVVLYANEACAPEGALPPFDDVFFASASSVESFLAHYGAGALRGKGVFVMGGPTCAALPKSFSAKARIFDILTATISGTVPANNKEKR